MRQSSNKEEKDQQARETATKETRRMGEGSKPDFRGNRTLRLGRRVNSNKKVIGNVFFSPRDRQ